MAERLEFKIGARVRLSALGKSKSRHSDRKGVVVGLSKTGTQYRVQWDGLKERDLIHFSFLEHDTPAQPAVATDSTRLSPT